MIKEDDIYLDLDFKNQEELFTYMNKIYLEKGYVHETYLDAVLSREKEYPTGICFEKYNIAIPHTDTEHIKEENIIFIRIKDDIEFLEMTTNEKIKTRLVLMLLVKNADHQISYLVKLMELLGDYENYKILIKEKDKKEIKKIFNK